MLARWSWGRSQNKYGGMGRPDLDLRGVLYVSREHAPLITPEDRLSSEAAELLTAILQHPDMSMSLKD
jgi:hypothetical protein